MPDQTTDAPRATALTRGLRAALAAALVATAAFAGEQGAVPVPAPAPAQAPAKTARQILDEQYVIGPTASDALGYRIAWQTEPLVTMGAQTQVVCTDADNVWFGDSAGSIVRLRRESGEMVWRSSTFKGLERMLAVQRLQRGKRDITYVVTETNCVVLETSTGELIRKASLPALPSNPPAIEGDFMIWGTRAGILGWYDYTRGFLWRTTMIGATMQAPVTVGEGVALAAGMNGTVLALDVGSASIRWTRKLAGAVESAVAMNNRAAFVASKDQSLWAFDLYRGRVLWQYFTPTPLVNEPVLVADGLYLQIPDQGLVCFNPLPEGKPDGEVRWKSTAPGKVIGRLGSNLLAWEQSTHVLSFVDAGSGRVVEMRTLPQVEWIQCSPKVNGDLWAAASDGRIEHLEPLARPTMVEESAAKPASAAKAAAPAPTPAPAGQQTPTGDEQPPAADSGMGATAQPLNPRLR
jgi:outer membrane protein assembly factor BamB